MLSSRLRPRGFSLIELLVVLAILSLLAALLLPAFLSARGQARQTVCLSNLRQIGQGIAMYQQDYDGFFPYSVDPATRAAVDTWKPYFPKYAADIPHLGLLSDVLQPYLSSSQVFACPSDTGFARDDSAYIGISATPSSYEQHGTSYYHQTLMAACHFNDSNIANPSGKKVLQDAVGFWHGSLVPVSPRFNLLFADGHAKNLTGAQVQAMRDTPFNLMPVSTFDAAKVCAQMASGSKSNRN